MKEIENDIIKKYNYKNYVVYAKWCKEELCYEFYLQNEEYGIITLMFGIPASDMEDMEDMQEIVLANIEDYIEIYEQDYED